MSGGAGNDMVKGGEGDDLVESFDGNDWLEGGVLEINHLIGGKGNDIYILEGKDTVTEQVGEGIDEIRSQVHLTLSLAALGNVENATLLGSDSLDATGNALANVLTGNAGNNEMTGDAGNDTLIGGLGNDTLNGGADNDKMVGGKDNEPISSTAPRTSSPRMPRKAAMTWSSPWSAIPSAPISSASASSPAATSMVPAISSTT